MANKITFTFSGTPNLGDYISFTIINETTLKEHTFSETFDSTRRRGTVAQPLCETTAYTAFFYKQSLELDTSDSLFKINHVSGEVVVEIILKVDGYSFKEFDSVYNGGVIDGVINNGEVDYGLFLIDSVVFSEATDAENKVRLTIATTGTAKDVYDKGDLLTSNNTDNPIVLDVVRGIDTVITLVDVNGITRSWGTGLRYLFPYFPSNSITAQITETLNGATIIVNVDYIADNVTVSSLTDLVFEYSLDGTNWQTSNIFYGQPADDYTISVRDQYGLTRTINVTVDGITSDRDPFLFISKANALNFKLIEEWDNVEVFKNEENTFEYQSLQQIKYCLPVLFQSNDTTSIQLKSNYANVEAKVRREDGTEQDLTITKRTANLDKYMKMDAIYYMYSNTYTGVYFENGKLYDEFGFESGSYTLYGNLPDLAIKGNYIEISGWGVHEIKDIVFDVNINKKVILVDAFFFSLGTALCTVNSIYDLLPYEVYEFEIDWSVFGIGLYDVVITNYNDENDKVLCASENISILTEHDQTLAIRYFNKNNRDIFYKYGIEHFIRVIYASITRGFDEEFEVSKGDLTSAVTDSQLRVVDKYVFPELTTSQMRTLGIALSCENLYINNVGYIKNSSLEIEQIENTNLYDVSVELLRTNINYTTNRQGQTGNDVNYIDFNIPAFITDDNGFLKV